MGDMAEDFRLLKKVSKERRLNNKEQSTKILLDNGINFTSHNDGVHLIISHNSKIVDFYPSTGNWIIRGKGINKRGIFNLLRYLNG